MHIYYPLFTTKADMSTICMLKCRGKRALFVNFHAKTQRTPRYKGKGASFEYFHTKAQRHKGKKEEEGVLVETLTSLVNKRY